MTDAISYDVKGAAAATGVSIDVIRRALRSGELTAHFPTSKPLIVADDLRRWVTTAPTERRAS